MRIDATEFQRLVESEARLAEAQRVAHMGSYDWTIASDTNEWSDELYRIYGTEPQSFNASYERFMEFIHPDDRAHVRAVHEEAFRTHEPYHTEERIVRPSGEVRVLSTTGEIDVDADGNPTRIYGICLDITEQRRAEEAAQRSEAAADEERRRSQEMLMRLHDADLRRQHALEINDNVVQGLAAVIYAFESGLQDEALAGLRRTIRSARMMMNGLLSGGDTAEMRAGDLLRGAPVTPMLRHSPASAAKEVDSPLRVLLVDDAADIRMVLRAVLDRKCGCKVVGEAEDGAAGVDMAKELQPDVVVLDLAMPVMDGLQALPMIRVAAPNAKVIVLSGFDKSRMEVTALGAGADAYVEKGHASRQLINAIAGLLPGRLDAFAI